MLDEFVIPLNGSIDRFAGLVIDVERSDLSVFIHNAALYLPQNKGTPQCNRIARC